MDPQIAKSDEIPMFIIDILHYDIENVQTLTQALNLPGWGWSDQLGRDFTQTEVIAVLRKLIEEGLVVLYRFSRKERLLIKVEDKVDVDTEIDDWETWFGLTESGKLAWENWIPKYVLKRDNLKEIPTD